MINARNSSRKLAVALCTLTLVAAACGSDDDSSSDTVSTQTTDTTTDVTEPDVTEPDDTAAATTTGEDDSGGAPGRDGVIDTFMRTGLTEEAANCVADKIEDEYGADVFTQPEPPADLQVNAQEFGQQCAQATVSIPTDAQGRDGFIQIAMSGGLNEETANCVADELEEEYDADIFDATDLPPDFQAEVAQFAGACAEEQAGL